MSPQSENAPMMPRSSYGISKLAGFHLTRNYREAYGMFACNGILFNHESTRRGFEFVTRKITDAAARIKSGLEKELRLGNLEARRDWGFAGDYVKALWMMLQKEKPDDFVTGTNETHAIREFPDLAFGHVDLDWKDYVWKDEQFFRPAEIRELRGDYSKAQKVLGWEPTVSFKDLVYMIVDGDLERYQQIK